METLKDILDDVDGLYSGSVRPAVREIAYASHRAGLLRAARRASAMAGAVHRGRDTYDPQDPTWQALMRLASKLREEAGEG